MMEIIQLETIDSMHRDESERVANERLEERLGKLKHH